MKKILLCLSVLLLFSHPANAQNSPQQVLSDSDLLQMAGTKYTSGELPLGDGHYTINEPRKSYIDLCRKFGEEGRGGAERDGPWIHGDTWNIREKLAVEGRVEWDNAQFSMTNRGSVREMSGNGLPITHATGTFPIQPDDPAYAYDRNPNSIEPQQMHNTLPANPVYTDPPFCMGMEVGIMLDGVPLFNGFDAGLRDAAAHEIQDFCQGHPQRSGQYHYHSLSSCIRDISVKNVIGYALDGFPITGPMVADGKYLTTGDLDECHGITSEIVEDGRPKVTYHYVMTVDFPYSASCFRARPVRTGPSRAPEDNSGYQSTGMDIRPQGPRTPPAEALEACSGRNDGDACGFTSPHGDTISGTCRTPPESSGLACVPAFGR